VATPQSGLFDADLAQHYVLEYRFSRASHAPQLRDALRAIPDLGAPAAHGHPHVVAAFGPRSWRALRPGDAPPTLSDFATLDGGNGRFAPATQNDVLLWVQSERVDMAFDAALAIGRAFDGAAALQVDLRGFRYLDSRDLTGFVDGSANPQGDARRRVAQVPDGEPGAGGSFVMSQRWVHDLRAFAGLAVPDQERVIGRTKADSVELEGSAMPPDSHVSRTDLKVDGEAVEIFRRSFPYGRVGEHGLYFLAFACAQSPFSTLLESMYGLTGDGLQDQLLSFTRPVTGSFWFAPTCEMLAAALSR
jgi:putative iron-dependent peroxidase